MVVVVVVVIVVVVVVVVVGVVSVGPFRFRLRGGDGAFFLPVFAVGEKEEGGEEVEGSKGGFFQFLFFYKKKKGSGGNGKGRVCKTYAVVKVKPMPTISTALLTVMSADWVRKSMLSAVFPSMVVVAARVSQTPDASSERARRTSVASVTVGGTMGGLERERVLVGMAVMEARAERASCSGWLSGFLRFDMGRELKKKVIESRGVFSKYKGE